MKFKTLLNSIDNNNNLNYMFKIKGKNYKLLYKFLGYYHKLESYDERITLKNYMIEKEIEKNEVTSKGYNEYFEEKTCKFYEEKIEDLIISKNEKYIVFLMNIDLFLTKTSNSIKERIQ